MILLVKVIITISRKYSNKIFDSKLFASKCYYLLANLTIHAIYLEVLFSAFKKKSARSPHKNQQTNKVAQIRIKRNEMKYQTTSHPTHHHHNMQPRKPPEEDKVQMKTKQRSSNQPTNQPTNM